MSSINGFLIYICPTLQRICLFSFANSLTLTEIFTLQTEQQWTVWGFRDGVLWVCNISPTPYIPTLHRNVLPTASTRKKKEGAHSPENFIHKMYTCKPKCQAAAQIIKNVTSSFDESTVILT